MIYIYILAAVGLIVSTIANRQKTLKALKTAFNIFLKIIPLILLTLIFISITLFFLPDHVIAKYLGTSDLLFSATAASLIGSISLLPGFVTFPLCGLLLNQGVSYTVIAAFSTSLMMVGIVTFPIEKKYFGTKLTIIRNIISFIIAIIISLIIGILYREIL